MVRPRHKLLKMGAADFGSMFRPRAVRDKISLTIGSAQISESSKVLDLSRFWSFVEQICRTAASSPGKGWNIRGGTTSSPHRGGRKIAEFASGDLCES
jgi:hypothetical protein